MSTVTLNLARKWRSKKFDQIVGQDLCVRILKNSLFKNQLFPVYLFSGQHGCGKTTTARVFASALNCEQLSSFQRDPQVAILPCLTCVSCSAMATNQHPDFIEIDAASNTGVDNVRQIIDASSLLPVMSTKKVYLIDEAHMLSKSAFNAFLKILEEPPPSVVFILATTDAQKILETVKSRCFQLFFDPIKQQILTDHLHTVCTTEAIAFEPNALSLIAQESRGSARDALNILEQVRFASGRLTPQTVQQVLGHVDDLTFVRLLQLLLTGDAQQLLMFCKEAQLKNKSADFLWRQMISVLRTVLWLHHGVPTGDYSNHEETLRRVIRQTCWKDIHAMIELFYENELLFTKTIAQYELFEMILLQIINKSSNTNDSSGTPPVSATSIPEPEDQDLTDTEFEDQDEDEEEEHEDSDEFTEQDTVWAAFFQDIQTLNEPLLTSICSRVLSHRYEAQTSTLHLTIAQEHHFFTMLLDQMAHLWKPILAKVAGSNTVTLKIELTERSVKTVKKPIIRPKTVPKHKLKRVSTGLDVSDVKKWPKTNLVLHYFPGTVKEVQGA